MRIFGLHAVAALIDNERRRIRRLLATDNAEHKLGEAIRRRGLAVERVRPRDLERLLGADSVHQGVLIEADALEEPPLELLCDLAIATRRPIVVLDQVTDPHNVGAILRSAGVLGSAGLVMTRRHSPPLEGVLAKAASGALEMVPVCLVGNLAQALARIGEQGLTRVGLDGEGERTIEEAPLDGGLALVLGSEGKGLRRLTRESCDMLCRIDADGGLASLNVSNAAAVALYAARRARKTS
jgi:23S rRNA (guanosine2251-2'-O)-methyltransferase